jgi:ABC-type nickel/cobalt efflux system permease component RcnA
MRRPHAAAVLLLLWLAVLTVAFHGCFLVRRTATGPVVAVPRKMLLAVASSFDAAAPTKHHHHPHHHHHHHHGGRWNWQGIPPSQAGGDGAEKRLVPTGPNPLHH